MTLKESIQGKKILFFSVQTFNLEKEIKKTMEENGAVVTYYDERPSNSNFTKGIIRLKRDIYQKKIDEYYASILEKIKTEKFDYLFVNRGEVITKAFLEKFIEMQPNCERIFFTWDSFANHGHPTTILKYFHRRFTFDPNDAEKYNIGFRPLYFLEKYRSINQTDQSGYLYDLLFLGTAHSDRYIISNKIADWCKSKGLNVFTYYYMHGKLVYFYQKLFDKSFKEFDYKKLSFTSLTTDQILELYKQSKVILDINHPGQTGLTMRSFESLGACKKLITTNKEIKKYPFYNSNNIFVIDRNNIQLDENFFKTEYEEINKDLYEKCSITGWLKEVMLNPEKDDWKPLMKNN